MNDARSMAIGLSIYKMGYHCAGWRLPDFPQDAMLSFAAYIDSAEAAEREKLDFVFFADIMGVPNMESPTRDISYENYVVKVDPIAALSALASRTTNIGLVGTMSTTYWHPYTVARSIGSLDMISGGRAGWNIVTSVNSDEMRNFGRSEMPDTDTRYARANEVLEVVKGLWNSWDRSSFVQNKESGTYVLRDEARITNHKGKFFSVTGPLDVAPSPQKQPIIVSAGDSEKAREFAAKNSDIQYAPCTGDLAAAQKYYADVKGRMAAFGRSTSDLHILPGIMPIVGETREEALQKRDQLRALVLPETGFALLTPLFGDLSEINLDDPLPRSVEPDPTHLRGYAKQIFDEAIAENYTVKQTYQRIADGEPWFMTKVGSGVEIADLMEEWFNGGAADGFNILPASMPNGFNDFAQNVLPELRRRNLFRNEYSGSTLRQYLGAEL